LSETIAVSEVLVFQCASFPANLASDPEATPDAAGEACLQILLDAIEGEGITARGPPIAFGSGFSAYVDSQGTTVDIHLTWFPAGPPGGDTRDVWTLQFARTGGWFRDLVRRTRGQPDFGMQTVISSVERVLQDRRGEFSEVRWCSWKDLEQ